MTQVFIEGDTDEPLEHDYDIVNWDAIVLSRSNGLQWNKECRGEDLLKLIDDGNGIVISGLDKKLKLDYCQVVKLLSLLLYYNKTKIELRESKVIKSI